MTELIDRQRFSLDDVNYQGSQLDQLHDAIFENPYCSPWPGVGRFPWPRYPVTLSSVLRGILPAGQEFGFLQAARRTIDSRADLRWGPDGLGYRKLLHPNGICLFGTWHIDTPNIYSGYFQEGSEGQIVARYSTCCTETRSGHYRSLSIVGKLFPTKDPGDQTSHQPASFITQEDLGGSVSKSIADVELRNAPDTTIYRRGWGAPILLLTGLTFLIADREPAFRQLYEIAELGKPPNQQTRAPKFMRLTIDKLPNPIKETNLDFRDEIMAQIYDPNDPHPKRTMTMHIEVSDEGITSGPALLQRRTQFNWQRIGQIVFHEAVASYNGDFVIHFHHPAWRIDRNAADTAIRQHQKRTRW